MLIRDGDERESVGMWQGGRSGPRSAWQFETAAGEGVELGRVGCGERPSETASLPLRIACGDARDGSAAAGRAGAEAAPDAGGGGRSSSVLRLRLRAAVRPAPTAGLRGCLRRWLHNRAKFRLPAKNFCPIF